MPKQSRGFWVCIYCERAFDQYQEAEFHERVQHLQFQPPPPPLPPPPSMAVSEPLPPNWGAGQQQYSTSVVPPPSQQQQHQQGMAPLSMEERRSSLPPPPQPKPVAMQRYLPLMGSQEPSHLSSSDTLACRSYELFEVTDLFGAQDTADQQGPVAGQVGLRCAFCAESSETTGSYVFPADTRSVGDSLRHSCFDHLTRCRHFPEEYRQQIEEALRRRKQLKDEGSQGPAAHEEEANRRALVDFCAKRCLQAGIVDRLPSGMVFADTEQQLIPIPMVPSQQMQQPRSYVPVQPPYPGMQQPPAQMTAKRRGGDEGSLEPTPLSQAVARYPPQQQQQPPPPQHMQHYSPVQNEFPYFYEQNRWVCKFCAHVPPPYRDPQYFWASSINNPPPGSYVDYHLSICREYQKAVMYDQQYAAYRDPRIDPRRGAMSSPAFGQPSGSSWDPQQQQQQLAMAPATPRGAEYSSPHGSVASPYNTQSYPGSVRGTSEPPQQQHQPAAIAATPMTQQRQPPSRRPEMTEDVARAIEYLEKNDKSKFDNEGRPVAEENRLVLEEDRLLLTEYFFYLMKQLRLVRFSEADRRTRGGKREKIQVGYGGLQCVHCVDIPNTRKFFWSNVDRLANSFAEIPSHVLKCRRCPQPTKDALLQLKQCHAEQMTRLPRGSQKVFFRRMWRRLHDADPQAPGTAVDPSTGYMTAAASPPPMMAGYSPNVGGAGGGGAPPYMRPSPLDTTPPASQQPPTTQPSSDTSPAGTSGSEESIYFLQRPSKEAAKALAAAAIQPGPPSPNSRVLLAIPEDKEWLSDIDCFIRRQLEVFCATEEDVRAATDDRKYPVKVGQVGIRCIHCAMSQSGVGATGQAVAFPFSISGIYEAAREFQRLHLESCENLPLSAKSKLESLKGSSSLSSVLRKYFVLAAKALGLEDSIHGIRAGAEAVPIGSQAAFSFAEGASGVSEEMKQQVSRSKAMRQSPAPSSESRKRKAAADVKQEQDTKRPAVASSPSHYAAATSSIRGESKDSDVAPFDYSAPAGAESRDRHVSASPSQGEAAVTRSGESEVKQEEQEESAKGSGDEPGETAHV